MVLKLYAVSDGPPTLAVRQLLKALNLDYQLVDVNFGLGEHMTEEYAKLNPQKEIPILDDDGFVLSESNAILQYICDKFAKDDKYYPKDAQSRAIVNQRLCFNLSTYYRFICHYTLDPIFFDYQKTPLSLFRVENSLKVFNTYLERLGKRYAAADNVTIADFQLVTATMCLEVINFDLTPYPLVKAWYDRYKKENPELWAIVEGGMKELIDFAKNPPDLTHLDHPTHPIRNKLNARFSKARNLQVVCKNCNKLA